MPTLLSELSRESQRRVVCDLIVDELQSARGRRFDPSGTEWEEHLALGPDGLDLDSLERFSVASRLNDFFALFESGVEDNLLRARTLGDTLDIVSAGLAGFSGYINVRTGGTTGTPRTIRHESATLEQEIRVLAELFSDRRRVVLLVPAHHIYGFLFGVLLPTRLRIPVVDARRSLLGGRSRPREGDMVVGVPYIWRRLYTRIPTWDAGVVGVSSTSPLDPELARDLAHTPLSNMIEVYGSSETGGIAQRDHCRADSLPPFELFPFWRRPAQADADYILERAAPDGGWTGARWELPDRIRWIDTRRLYPEGRRDAVVQVGGNNVDLDQLRRRIVDLLPPVTDCALRLDASGERLRAFLVVPTDCTEVQREQLSATLRRTLRDHEIPTDITWGSAIPRTQLGKTADW